MDDFSKDLVPAFCQGTCRCTEDPGRDCCAACGGYRTPCEHLDRSRVDSRVCELLAHAEDLSARRSFLDARSARCGAATLARHIAARTNPPDIDVDELANEFLIRWLERAPTKLHPELSHPSLGGFRGYAAVGLGYAARELRRREVRQKNIVSRMTEKLDTNQYVEPSTTKSELLDILHSLRADDELAHVALLARILGIKDHVVAAERKCARESVVRARARAHRYIRKRLDNT